MLVTSLSINGRCHRAPPEGLSEPPHHLTPQVHPAPASPPSRDKEPHQ